MIERLDRRLVTLAVAFGLGMAAAWVVVPAVDPRSAVHRQWPIAAAAVRAAKIALRLAIFAEPPPASVAPAVPPVAPTPAADEVPRLVGKDGWPTCDNHCGW
jgi:hypothetical protein